MPQLIDTMVFYWLLASFANVLTIPVALTAPFARYLAKFVWSVCSGVLVGLGVLSCLF